MWADVGAITALPKAPQRLGTAISNVFTVTPRQVLRRKERLRPDAFLRREAVVLLDELADPGEQLRRHRHIAGRSPRDARGLAVVAAEEPFFRARPEDGELGVADQVIVAGFFDADIRESYEMLYQYDSEYLFDSTRFSTAFHFIPTSYEDGIRRCATP